MKKIIKLFKIYFSVLSLAMPACSSKTTKSTNSSLSSEIESVVFIPSRHQVGAVLETTIFESGQKNSDKPIVVINHGTNPGGKQQRERSIYPVRYFLSLGMTVILPMRRGYSQSTGDRATLKGCNLREYGLENAYDIEDAVSWIEEQPQFKNRKIIMIGQSTGGLAVMAYSSLATNKASAIINFHGGMRPRDSDDCKWQARIDAFRSYAASSKPISFWIYTANAHSSTSEYIGQLYKEFIEAGGKARLALFGAFKKDGHYLFGDREGGEIWQPKVFNYLRSLDLITE